jgi:excisionase family DNA binding protein
MARITFRVEDEVYDRLLVRAMRSGRTVSDLIRPAVARVADPTGKLGPDPEDARVALLACLVSLLLLDIETRSPEIMEKGPFERVRYCADGGCPKRSAISPSLNWRPAMPARIRSLRQPNLPAAGHEARTLIAQDQRPEPLTVRIRTATALTGIGRSKLYELIAAGEIETVKIGSITLIPMASLRSLIERSAKGAQGIR